MAKAESTWRPRYPYATPHIAWPSAVVVCPGSAGWSTGGAQPAQNRGGTVVSTKYPNPSGARRHQRWQTRVDRLEALGQARAEELTLVASHRIYGQANDGRSTWGCPECAPSGGTQLAKVSRAGVVVDERARGDADRPLASVAPPGGWEYGTLIMGDAETRVRVLVSRFGGPAY